MPLYTAAFAALTVSDELGQFYIETAKPVDTLELAEILTTLNATHGLPNKFVTKREAQHSGWQRGHSLWDAPALHGKSIGGDKFSNFERQLPAGLWREADLDYKGGHRGAKRLVFSAQGKRFVTVDHYQTYTEVPTCL